MISREKQKQIIREYMQRWGEKFKLYSKYINDFSIPRERIAPELGPLKFKKLWNELVEEIEKEKKLKEIEEI